MRKVPTWPKSKSRLCLGLACLMGISLFVSAPEARSEGSFWILITRNGRDTGGASAFDRFEVTPDGLAIWEASSTGVTDPSCPNGGGRFQSSISVVKARELAGDAVTALKSQGPVRQEETKRSGQVLTTVTVEADGKFYRDVIQKSTQEWEKLLNKITELKRALEPEGVIAMTAARSGRHVDVRFTLIGDKSAALLLPPHPEEAFYLSGIKPKYEGKLKSHEVILSAKNRSHRVRLSLENVPQGETQLLYSNAQILHHSRYDKISDKVSPSPLTLCTTLQ